MADVRTVVVTGATGTVGGRVPAQLATQIVRGQLAMAESPEPMSADVARIPGRPALPYARWARDHAADFR
ncbi:hypothetical protein [Pseudonocardia humida]|uniref:Male sterility protein n=1 Tax=Pseudonocardia humida TaxID=2800819 RepID=A0ABT1A6N5_9PSEU|nr:hypothetical protein [Pseudonocardia humida]MCO1658596.1 hypothetical protein [Pseudonocardia humida]